MFISHLSDGLEISGQTEQIDTDDDTRRKLSSLNSLFNLTLKIGDVHIESVLVDIDENRSSALHGNDFGRSKESETWDKDSIARLHVPNLQGKKQGIGAAIASHAMLHAHILGKSCFHLLDFRPHDKSTGGNHIKDGLVHFVLKDSILCF